MSTDDRYEITTVPGGLDVRCRECAEVLEVRDGQARGQLVHDDDCSHGEIKDAMKLLDFPTIQ